MASRILYGSRHNKQKEKEEELSGKVMGASRRPAVPQAVSTSKIPSHTSMFSRHRSKRDEEKVQAAAQSARQTVDTRLKPTEQSYRGVSSSRRDVKDSSTGYASSQSLGSATSAPPLNVATRQPPTPTRRKLRRKTSSSDERGRYTHSVATTSTFDPATPPARAEAVSSPGGYVDPFPGSVLGISLPTTSQSTSQIPTKKTVPTAYATSNSRMATYVPKQTPPKLSTQDLPPPTLAYIARSSSASTRASESPGPFSRTSTPTSISSHSPGITVPPKFVSRLKLPTTSTSRPPVTKRKVGTAGSEERVVEDQGLPPLRESSSSSSTVKASEHPVKVEATQNRRESRLAAPAPIPPLRLSSKRLPKPQGKTQEAISNEKSSTVSQERRTLSTQRPSVSESKIPAFNSSASRVPPPRPSREGTPALEKQRPSPIIQSNLTHFATSGHTRRQSMEKALLVSPVKTTNRGGLPTLQRSPSNASTMSKTTPQPATSADPVRAQSPHLYSSERTRTRDLQPLRTDIFQAPSKQEPSSMSDTSAKSPSRFNLFGRRAKSPNLSSEKLTKKGPAAGTGHEGYGKYARRGRSGSVATTASRGRSTSTDRSSISFRPSTSRKSSFTGGEQPDLDEFYKDRLEPVVIGGGGRIKENRNSTASLYRTSSGESSTSITSSANFGPPIPARSQLRRPDYSTEESSLASSQRTSSELMPPPKFDIRGGVSDLGTATLAHRRSLHRLQLFKEAEPLKIPPPIDTQAKALSELDSAALDSFDALNSSVPWSDSSLNLTDLSDGHEGNWLRPKKPQPRVKLPNKWNFFHRAQQSPKRAAASDQLQRFENSRELPASISKVSEARSVPYYAMMEGSEKEDDDDLSDILRNIEDDLELRNRSPSKLAVQGSLQQERKYSMLLPSPPQLPADFNRVQTPAPALEVLVPQKPAPIAGASPVQAPPAIKNRLQQVGRIPRVISKRDRPHKPAPQSFSRPFTRPPNITAASPASRSVPEIPVIPEEPTRMIQTEPLPSAPWTVDTVGKPPRPAPTNGMLFNLEGEKEFLTFMSRKDSEVSGSSSSGILSFAGMTALLPRPDSLLKDDEVWNEYDELLDHVSSPTSIDSTSWSGRDEIINSFPVAEVFQQVAKGSPKKESPVIVSTRSSSSTAMAPSPPIRPVRTGLPRRSNPLLQLPSPEIPEVTPSTPMSFSDLYAGYANRSSAGMTNRHSTSTGSRYSSQSTGAKADSGSLSIADTEHVKRYTQEMADKIKGTIGSPDAFRFSALMTARWLSFDRVLFSPVQEEIRNNRQDRVLVLDGLDNDDWSSYCALTYPDAVIYNLGSPRPLSGTKRGDNPWQPPSNHRQIHHSDVAHPFPFPRGFFTAVVLRFPVVVSEAGLRNAVSECKRVLRPGGYLEMCILDMDMVNMGNRLRRALRGLKVRMQIADPDVSLSPVSDNIQKMLGRRGFENLNRCVVGVPVAGSISGDSRNDSQDENEASLGEMLRNPATRGGDVPITQMVAKVGRWWWSRCYEKAVLSTGDAEASIWGDRNVLRECEKRGTGFRLVVCYAQKPVAARRRTVSV